MGIWAHIFFPCIPSWTGYHLGKKLHLPTELMLPSLWSWAFLATNRATSLCCVYYSFAFLFISYYLVGLLADVPTMSTHFFVNPLLRAFLAHFPCHYLFWAYWPTLLSRQPILPPYSLGFLNPFTTTLPLFTPMDLLLNSLGFIGPFYTFTSYYLFGFIGH